MRKVHVATENSSFKTDDAVTQLKNQVTLEMEINL